MAPLFRGVCVCAYVFVCVCVCVCEGEGERFLKSWEHCAKCLFFFFFSHFPSVCVFLSAFKGALWRFFYFYLFIFFGEEILNRKRNRKLLCQRELNKQTDPTQFRTVFTSVYMWRTLPPQCSGDLILPLRTACLFSYWLCYHLNNIVNITILSLNFFSKNSTVPLVTHTCKKCVML